MIHLTRAHSGSFSSEIHSVTGTDKMTVGALAVGVISSYTMVGILGNFSLLYHYWVWAKVFIFYFTGCGPRSIDLILKRLIIANSLGILPKGVPTQWYLLGGDISSMTNVFCMFTEWAGLCPRVAAASGLSSRPSWSGLEFQEAGA